MKKGVSDMTRQGLINRLEVLKELVEQSESDMKLAIVSYRKYQEDLSYIMGELDKIEDEIKALKNRSIFDLWFGDPMRQIDEDFNSRVHKAIEDCNETGY
jgi:hypothetical protein